MFLLKVNGKKWLNSEVSVLQGNRRQFMQYLTLWLQRTAVFYVNSIHSSTLKNTPQTQNILHISFSIQFHLLSPFSKHTICTDTHSVPHEHTKRESACMYCFPSSWEVKHVKLQQHTCSRIKYWRVKDTWSNARRIPKGTTLDKLLPVEEKKKAGFEQKEQVYMMSFLIAEMELEMGQSRKGLRLGTSNLLSHWRETGSWEVQNGKYFKMIGDIKQKVYSHSHILSCKIWV